MKNLNNLISEIDTVDFIEGSVRSLALKIKKFVGDENAWNIARQVADACGKDFTREKAITFIKNLQAPKTTVKEAKAQVKTQKSTGDSKNERIREMILKGTSISDIAKAVGVKYQRAKNVEKAMKKKGALAEKE